MLRDRRLLSESGLIILVATIDKNERMIVSGPDIISRGFVYVRENEDLIDAACERAESIIIDCLSRDMRDWNGIKTAVREGLRKYMYIERCARMSEIDRTSTTNEKTGVFIGKYAVNPFTGKTMPIFISDYVLMGYGTGAVMGVPAHDQRDFEFARKYNLEIVPVIDPEDPEIDLNNLDEEDG